MTRRWKSRPNFGFVQLLPLALFLVPGSPMANEEPRIEREIIDLVPDQRASAGITTFLAPFTSIFLGPGYWYGQRSLEVDTTPQGAFLDVFYVRGGFQKRFEQGESPARILLPTRIEAGPRDTVTIRALVDGYREREVSLRVRSRDAKVMIDLTPLPNSLVAVSSVALAGRGSLTFLTTEALAFRLQKSDEGLAVVLSETANIAKASEAMKAVSNSLIESLRGRQLGEDLVVVVRLTDAARDTIEIRSAQSVDAVRGLHGYTLNFVPPDQGAAAVRRARAGLARIRADQVLGCALDFDQSLREALDPADLARALAPRGAFTDPFLRAAMKRLGELSPKGVVSLIDGSSYLVAAPIELMAAMNQASEVRAYLSLLRQFVAELELEGHRRATLRGLIASEIGPAHFDEVLDRAEASERRCNES